MAQGKIDELDWRIGHSEPHLYGTCLIAWGGLGDLVHDSDDPTTLPPSDRSVDSFLIFTNSDTDAIMHISMASWVHTTYDSDQRTHNERRFMVTFDESERGTESNSLSRRIEVLIGQGAVITTIEVAEVTSFEDGSKITSVDIASGYGYDAVTKKVITTIIRHSPTSRIAQNVGSSKKAARRALHDGASAIHGALIDCEDTFLGVPASSAGNPVAVCGDLRKAAGRVNGIRLPLMSAHQYRLFDKLTAQNAN